MGNKPARTKTQRPYNDMVEDAISALKDRPGTTQADVINYLESKYKGRLPRAQKNLKTVIRSVIKAKKRGNPGRPIRSAGRKVRFKAKSSLNRSKLGRLRSRGNARRLVSRPGKKFKKKLLLKPPKFGKKLPLKPQKFGKKLHTSGSKLGGHRRLKRKRGGILETESFSIDP